MNVDRKTIDKYAENLNLDAYWRKSDEERYSNNIKSKKEEDINYREDWLFNNIPKSNRYKYKVSNLVDWKNDILKY